MDDEKRAATDDEQPEQPAAGGLDAELLRRLQTEEPRPGQKQVHICPQCHKTYAKAEHLRRHERSHLGLKPFTCRECGRKFARQDVLTRHLKVHARRSLAAAASDVTSSKPNSPAPRRDGGRRSGGGGGAKADKVQQILSISNSYASRSRIFEDRSPDPDPDPDPQTESTEATEDRRESASLERMDVDVVPPPPLRKESEPEPEEMQPFVRSARSSVLDRDGSTAPPRSEDVGEMFYRPPSQPVADVSMSFADRHDLTEIDPSFLDEALHMFFSQFNPVFPILHLPTFISAECDNLVRLNAIAIGSLFMGSAAALVKGERLWQLAHTATITALENLIVQGKPDAPNQDIEVVLAAVLGQIYAMLSKDGSIRLTARTDHDMICSVARFCRLLFVNDRPRTIPSKISADDLDRLWRAAMAREVQLRALLANYIIDGQLTQFSGDSPRNRHNLNPLPVPYTDAIFEAAGAREWAELVRKDSNPQYSFQEIFKSTFSSPTIAPQLPIYSEFSLRVVLEGFQALVVEDVEVIHTAIAHEQKQDISRALVRLYEHIVRYRHFSPTTKAEALIRWHNICLDAALSSASLCQTLSLAQDAPQHILRGLPLRPAAAPPRSSHPLPPAPATLLRTTLTTLPARCALLHAVAIHTHTASLPLSRSHAPHLPAALFAAATVYAAFALHHQAPASASASSSSSPSIAIPRTVDWPTVLQPEGEASPHLRNATESREIRGTLAFLLGAAAGGKEGGGGGGTSRAASASASASAAAASAAGAGSVGMERRNLRYEVSGVRGLLGGLKRCWGLAGEMEGLVGLWLG